MSEYLSKKISFFHVIGLFFVLLIHAPLNSSFFLWNYLQQYIENIAFLFIPLYFTISGYLFFFTIDTDNIKTSFRNKILRRVKTLLIPLLLGLFVCNLSLELLSRMQIQTQWVVEYNSYSHFDRLFFPWHLWFVKDLFLLSFFTPILYYVLKNTNIAFFYLSIIVPLLIAKPDIYISLAYIGYNSPINMLIGFNLYSLCFFSIGAYWSVQELPLVAKKIINKFVIVFFVGILFFVAYMQKKELVEQYFYLVSFLLFLILWILYDRNPHIADNRYLKKLTSKQFFIYLLFEPLFGLLKSATSMLYKSSLSAQFFFYFFLPIVLILVLYNLAKFVEYFFPNAYKVFVGKR